MSRTFLPVALAVFLLVSAAAFGQGRSSSDVAPFIGTWVFDMTSPEVLQGTHETIRIWEKDGDIAASIQVQQFPPNNVTGILKDGELLVLTTTLRENGQPIWVAIGLKREGDAMKLAQMMERSDTIKRGTGKKSPNP